MFTNETSAARAQGVAVHSTYRPDVMLIGRARCRPKCQGACPGHPVDVGRPEFRCDGGGY